MAARFVQEGSAVDYTPVADVVAGDVVVQGDLVGIAKHDIAANTLGAIALSGVFDLPKATGAGSAIAVGSLVYWDATAGLATTDDAVGANKLLGKTVAATVDADATVRVRLDQ